MSDARSALSHSAQSVNRPELLAEVAGSYNVCLDTLADSATESEWESAQQAGRGLAAASTRARFWAKVSIDASGCWLWQSNIVRGYGQFCLGRDHAGKQHNTYAHRFAYELVHGRLPSPDIKACHRCDVRLCVRSSHLFAGTQADNLNDARAKGRLDESRPRTRLDGFTPQQRLDIFDMPARRGLVTDLARQFGVSKACVSAIRKGRFVRLAPDSSQQRLQASPAPLLDGHRAAEILGRVFERVAQRQLPVLDILSPEIGMV